MANNNSSSFNSGVGFVGLLLIAFIVLKLCGVINWSWWWVLSPAWIYTVLLVIVLSGLGFYNSIKKKKAKGKFVDEEGKLQSGPPKSKWQQRLEEMQALRGKETRP